MKKYIVSSILANLALLPGEMGVGYMLCMAPGSRPILPMGTMMLCLLGFFFTANIIAACVSMEEPKEETPDDEG
jgi:hypothetical protein